MNSVLSVLADLDETDVDWLLSNGVEQQVIANDILTETGKMPGALYVVLEGLVGVWVDSLGRDMIRTLGPGQFVGEMAFLEEKPATATVSAIENSLLLSLPRDMLQAKIDTDPAFGLRLYRGLARLLSDRLRGSMAVLGHRLQSATSVTQAVSGRWDTIAAALEKLKHLLADADQAALHNDGELPRDVADRILAEFRVFALWLNSELGDDGPGSAEVRQELGARVQREMLPYLMLTENGERWYAKPRGYAGDFLSIEWIYNNKPTGKGRLGTVLDQCFLDMPAAQAVRNRRGLLCEEIDATIASKNGEPARVLSMAYQRSPFSVSMRYGSISRCTRACSAWRAVRRAKFSIHLPSCATLRSWRRRASTSTSRPSRSWAMCATVKSSKGTSGSRMPTSFTWRPVASSSTCHRRISPTASA
jgi:extracellular factor (EF) 3-hydroxypalmitic acid methyl ester biosynthesis protein